MKEWVKVGQKVKYEIGVKQLYANMKPFAPRYDNGNRDLGSTGCWAVGEITAVNPNDFYIKSLEEVEDPDVNRWVIYMNDSTQWDRPGFFQPIDTPEQKTGKPPFMDKKVLEGIEYRVYAHTAQYDTCQVIQTAYQEFQKILSRRLREWPRCCGEYVKISHQSSNSGLERVYTPAMHCIHCKTTVKGGE